MGARLAQAAVLTMLLLVALPAAAAQAVVPVKPVTIVPPSTTCKALFACFKPSSLSVLANTKVVWTNKTALSHTVSRCTLAACGVSPGTGKPLTAPSSPIIGPGKTFSFLFTGKGTYVYYCKIHGYKNMHGTVTVT
jgi:plastocyanin